MGWERRPAKPCARSNTQWRPLASHYKDPPESKRLEKKKKGNQPLTRRKRIRGHFDNGKEKQPAGTRKKKRKTTEPWKKKKQAQGGQETNLLRKQMWSADARGLSRKDSDESPVRGAKFTRTTSKETTLSRKEIRYPQGFRKGKKHGKNGSETSKERTFGKKKRGMAGERGERMRVTERGGRQSFFREWAGYRGPTRRV